MIEYLVFLTLIFSIFALPIVLIALFVVELYRYSRYISAKKRNKVTPGAFPDEEINRRKKSTLIILGALAVVAFVFLAIIIGITILLTMAVAYM